MRRRVSWFVPLLLVTPAAVLGTLLGGCGSGPRASSSPVTLFDVSADPGAGVTAIPTHRGRLTLATLRATLDSLLSRHVTLVGRVMHDAGAGNDEQNDATRALAANTTELTDTIATVYGADAARAFAQLWEQHTQFFVDYAHAVRTHDRSAKREALSRLADYQDDFGSFVATATGGVAGLRAVTALLHEHVADMTRYVDDDVAGRAARAQEDLDQADGHMRVIARAVSDAIAVQHPRTVEP